MGSVRVPDDAGAGMAKVTLGFPNWKDRPVAPATFDIPIKDAPPKQEAPKRHRWRIVDWGIGTFKVSKPNQPLQQTRPA
jgi:hypothetical protein